jgi:hypothetical protein
MQYRDARAYTTILHITTAMQIHVCYSNMQDMQYSYISYYYANTYMLVSYVKYELIHSITCSHKVSKVHFTTASYI